MKANGNVATILEVYEVCPYTKDCIRILLLKSDDCEFQVLVDPEPATSKAERQPNLVFSSRSETESRAMMKIYVEQISTDLINA